MTENTLVKAGSYLPKLFRSTLNWIGSPAGAFVLIFILAFAVRAYSWIKVPPYLPSTDRELGAIAQSLAETGQFANPYIMETGPTAHLPPVHPAILAFVLSKFGRTWQAGYVFWSFVIMTNAATYAPIPWIAVKLGMNRTAGFLAGVAGALIPELEESSHGEGLAGIALALMLAAFLKRWSDGRSSLSRSLLLGLGIGASFHVQPPILVVFLGYLVFEIGWSRIPRKFAMSGTLVLGVLLACIPWTWRNYNVFHEFFFIRSNLGLELRMGNHQGAAATYAQMDREGHLYQHPRLLPEEALKVEKLGEVEYMRQAMDDALHWMKKEPDEFIKLTLLRFVHFWFIPQRLSPSAALIAVITILAVFGLIRIFRGSTLPQRISILTPLFTYPLIYYLVPFMPRYRTPIDWLIFLLAGVEVWHWMASLFRSRKAGLFSLC